MAHNLEQFSDGTASVFSHRKPMWHQLGIIVDQAPTSAKALKLARLDWEVSLEPVYVMTSDGMVEVANRRATVRPHPETGKADVLGIVGLDYTPVQNAEAFAFCDALVAESADPITYETAGAIAEGRQVFMSMYVPRDVVLDPKGVSDKVELYIICTTSHDGTQAFTVAITAVRPVCANTVAAGLKRAVRSWSVRHTTSATTRIAEARDSLGMTFAYADAFEAEAKALYEQAATDKQFHNIVAKLLPIRNEDTDLQQKRQGEKRDAVIATWDLPTQDGIRNTAWGVYNTVAEWVDWGRESKSQRMFEPRGAVIKQRAWELAGAIK